VVSRRGKKIQENKKLIASSDILCQLLKMCHFKDFLRYRLHLKHCNINFMLLETNI